jgi:hypothetical protein
VERESLHNAGFPVFQFSMANEEFDQTHKVGYLATKLSYPAELPGFLSHTGEHADPKMP